jgi:hypothetical protein
MQPLPVTGLLRVRVRAGVGEPVAVRRPPAEEPSLRRRLGAHGRPDAGLDPHPLALRHSAEEHHHEIVRLGARVDGAADLGHPQLDAVVGEHREREPELVAVEGALRFADDDRIEAPVRSSQCGQQSSGLGPALPRQRPALPDVEELGDDLAAGRLDEGEAAVELPLLRRLRILLVLGAHPAVEGERDHADLLTLRRARPPDRGSPAEPSGASPGGRRRRRPSAGVARPVSPPGAGSSGRGASSGSCSSSRCRASADRATRPSARVSARR